MSMLAVKDVTKSFGGLTAVNSVSFEVTQGQIMGLIGPNGSGKTSTFNLITGFVKPDAGSISMVGKDITGLKPPQVCQAGIARTFQLVKPFGHMTSVQNVMIGRLYGSNPARNVGQAREEADELLDFVGLRGRGEIPAKNLTLVERKRLELARALATRPRLLLLDEIMGGLNPTETNAAMELVMAIRQSGVTVIMVEHIVKAVFAISDRVIVLNAGEKIAEGKPEELARNPQVIQAYLGRSAVASM